MNWPPPLHLSKVPEHGGSIMKRVIASIGRVSVRASVSASVAAAGVVAVTVTSASAESRPRPFETEFDVSPGATPQIASLQIAPTAVKWQESIAEYLEGLVDDPAPVVETATADPETPTDVVTAEVKAFAVADEPDPEAAPEPQAEAKAEATAEAKPEAQAEVKPLPPEVLEALGIDPIEAIDAKQDVLVAVPAKAEAKADADVDDDDADDVATAEAKPAAQPEAQPAVHVEVATNPLLLAPVLSHPSDCELCRAGGGEWVEVSRADDADGQDVAPEQSFVDDAVAWEKLAEWASSRIAADQQAKPADDVATIDEDGFPITDEDPTRAD
jgi:hypothetical protein